MNEEDEDEDDELEWTQVGTTTEGYPIYECVERPGIQRIAVPIKRWREFYG